MITPHQEKQMEVINAIEAQVAKNSLDFSTIEPVKNYEDDPRMCLTTVHLPNHELTSHIVKTLIEPLKSITEDCFYYTEDSLHLTIKNIRTVSDPQHFDQRDVVKAADVFDQVIPQHVRFRVYFYRLLLFPNNLALIGTTDPELDKLVLDLDSKLKQANLADDKKYLNDQYFFCNMTLARFSKSPTEEFKKKVLELSKTVFFEPYTVDSVTMLTCNAALHKRKIVKSWPLK